MDWILVVLVVMVSSFSVEGLECYQCGNLVYEQDNPQMKRLLPQDELDPTCDNPGPSTNKGQCLSGEQCALFKVKITREIPRVGNLTVRARVRGCKPTAITGCLDEGEVKEELSQWQTENGQLGEIVDGKICYCDSSLCVAGSGSHTQMPVSLGGARPIVRRSAARKPVSSGGASSTAGPSATRKPVSSGGASSTAGPSTTKKPGSQGGASSIAGRSTTQKPPRLGAAHSIAGRSVPWWTLVVAEGILLIIIAGI